MSHVHMRELLQDAQERGYGVPNLWGSSMEMLLGQIQAAEELHAPLSLCYCAGQYPEMPLELGVRLIITAAEHAKAPIMTTLDHGTDFESCVRTASYGASAVMYDGSYQPYNENLEATREIVKVAHAIGVGVEAELGAVGGNAAEWGRAGEFASVHTDPDQVADFVAKTEVDALAVSFGNRHGLYHGKTDLDFALLQDIRKKTNVPLVMHGASDMPDEMYPKVVEHGISKVHFWSGPSKLAVQNLQAKLAECATDAKEPLGYQDVFRWNVDFFREITKKYLILLNARDKGNGLSPAVNKEKVR